MYVHKEKRVVYLAHMKVGSRAVRDVLNRRGFVSVFGHHGGPWHGRQEKFENDAQSWWWEQDIFSYQFFYTVRNHFDIIRTFWYWQQQKDQKAPFPTKAVDLGAFLNEFMWRRTAHFHHARNLFRFVQEVGLYQWFDEALVPRSWKFENQRSHLQDFLAAYDFRPLAPGEYDQGQPNSAFVTMGKPNAAGGAWQDDYTPETRAYVEDRFGSEMDSLRYRFAP